MIRTHQRFFHAMFLTFICIGFLKSQPLSPQTKGKPSPHGKEKIESPIKISSRHYRIYDRKGKEVTLEEMLAKAQKNQVIFLGELHDDPVAHHLQEIILQKLQGSKEKQFDKVALSMEMFERDTQAIVDEYLAGLITEQQFLTSSRPWKNYKEDYRPLVEFAREKGLAVIAANPPRRYVNRVGRLGADSLREIPEPFARGLPPLPYSKASKKYADRFKEVMEKSAKEHQQAKTKKDQEKKNSPSKGKESPQDGKKQGGLVKSKIKPAGQEKKVKGKTTPPDSKKKAVPKFDMKKALEAQSLWDAGMAYSIADYLLRYPHSQIVHLNGSFHSEHHLGIPEHLLRYRPGTSVLVITMVAHKRFPHFDAKEMVGSGDFIIVTDPEIRKNRTKK